MPPVGGWPSIIDLANANYAKHWVDEHSFMKFTDPTGPLPFDPLVRDRDYSMAERETIKYQKTIERSERVAFATEVRRRNTLEREAAGGAQKRAEEAEAHRQRTAVLRGEVAALQLELATLRRAATPLDGSGTYEEAAAAAAAAAAAGREQAARAAAKVAPKVAAGRAGSPEAPFADKAESTVPAAAESPA